MREMRCPVCAGAVPRWVRTRKTFPCPNCKEPIRVRDFSKLWGIPLSVCGLSLTFLAAYLMGLRGNTLLLVTVLLATPAAFLLSASIGLLAAMLSLFYGVDLLPWELERDRGLGFYYSRILHINSPPTPPKSPE